MFAKSFVNAVTATLMLAGAVQAFTNTVYVISNSESLSLGAHGLSPVGVDRAENCIPTFFGGHDIGLIVTCTYDPSSGLCAETEATAAPVAQALDLTPDTSCHVDDDEEDEEECIYRVISTFAATSNQAVLVVWDWNEMDDVFDGLDVDDDFDFDDNNNGHDDDDDDDESSHFDLVATVVDRHVTSFVSMECPGIDVASSFNSHRRRSFKSNKARNMKKKRSISSLHSRISRRHNKA